MGFRKVVPPHFVRFARANTRCTRTPPRLTAAFAGVPTNHQRGCRRRELLTVATPVSFTVRPLNVKEVSPSLEVKPVIDPKRNE